MEIKQPNRPRPAGFWLRFWAWLFDFAMLTIALAAIDYVVRVVTGIALVSFIVSLIDRGLTGGLGALLALAALLFGWLVTIVVAWFLGQVFGWVYYALFESSSTRATPGKMLLELQVVDAQGEQISFGRATLRHFLKFAAFYPAILALIFLLFQVGRGGPTATASVLFGISVLLSPVLFFIFYGMAGWTREKRALHDIGSGCYVVRAQVVPAGRALAMVAGIVVVFLLVQVVVPAIWNIYSTTDRMTVRAESRKDVVDKSQLPAESRKDVASTPELPAPAAAVAPPAPEPSTADAPDKPEVAATAPATEPANEQVTASVAVPVPKPRSVAASAASGAELHVVGINHGAYPPGTDTRPWWAKCTDDPAMKKEDCHSKYAGLRETSFAKVTVTYNRAPVILALLGSDPVNWDVHIAPDVQLEKVILAGQYRQEIKGIHASIPVEVYGNRDAFACVNCTVAGKGFYAYDAGSGDYDSAMRRLNEISGMKPASVQLINEGREFFVGPMVKRYGEMPDQYKRWEKYR